MPSSASTVLRLEKPATGEKTGLWSTIYNLNYDILEASIAGTTSISTTGGTTTLTNVDYINDQAKKRMLYVSGTLVSNAIIVVPNASKTYVIVNATAGAYTLTIKTSVGSAIAITQGAACEVWCDGSNVMLYVSPMVVTGTGAPSSASGAAASSVSVSATGNLASTNAQAALAELQGDIDTINTALGNKQALDSDLTTLAGLSTAKGNTIVSDGSAWAAVTVGANGLVMRANSAASSGVVWAAGAPTGTIAPFQQTAAPTGWTKAVTHNDKALRVVSGTASSGGTTAFTSVFAARTIAQANLPNVNLTAASNGAHTHTVTSVSDSTVGTDGGGAQAYATTRTTSSDGAHTHTVPLGGSGTAMDFAVQYVDLILATAD